MTRYALIDTADYKRHKEKARESRRRYEQNHQNERKGWRAVSWKQQRKDTRDYKKLHRPFIFWDGESPKDTGYSLFGNSAGYEICHPQLSTRECLELITECGRNNPQAIHISFGFNLDVSFILKDLPHHTLRALAFHGKCVWGFWTIEHIPHKWFKVTYNSEIHTDDKVTVKIFDYRTFFNGTYVESLKKFNVGTPQEIAILTSEKARRAEFMWSEIKEIREYWLLELKLGPMLGDALRNALSDAGYLPDSWHGPGALARMAFKRHNVYAAMAKCPARVRDAARYAYAGGRFDQYIIGEVNETIYEADINSAYPFYASQLPNLARGSWRNGRKFESGKFALYHIRYDPYDHTNTLTNVAYCPLPLFRRYDNHMVRFPARVEGWYWAPEAELVKDDPNATFLEAIIFDEDDPTDRPFAFLIDYYRKRKLLDKTGSIAGYTYKILINAIYGQLAQRAGWDKKKKTAPKSHQLEWAGFITSACRAAVYKVAVACGDKLVSINTDSVQALCPLDDIVDEGKELGQWEIKTFTRGLFWQAGIYYLQEDTGYDPSLDYGWSKARTRGIPKGQYKIEDMRAALYAGEPLRLKRHMFITYSLAYMGQWDKINTWSDTVSEFGFGGNDGKRSHGICAQKCAELSEHMHKTFNNPWINDLEEIEANGIRSKPHYLPWIDGEDAIKQEIDTMMVDVEEMELELEEWDYAA